jgi:Tol biopolymer transport system component
MSSPERACRVRPGLTVSVATTLVALGTGAMLSGQSAVEGARLVALQRVRAEIIHDLRAAELSADGRLVAFVSQNPESSGRHCCLGVYVLDRSTGLTARESVRADGTPADGDSRNPSLDQEGRLIAFETVSSNLVSGRSQSARRHIVVRNRHSRLLQTPKSRSGGEPDGEAGQPEVSGNGLAVVFTSGATNLVPGRDANGGHTDIYAWRLDDSTIARISVDAQGVQPSLGASHSPGLSRDGELVTFVSTARLAPEDTNDATDVYLRDLRHGTTSLVSRAAAGRSTDDPSHSPVLSADGRYVAFVSRAGNLAARDSNQERDVYLYEVASRSITLVSATSKGAAANAPSSRPSISADGRFVVYQSIASNLGSRAGCHRAEPDVNLVPDVYLYDRVTRCVTRISGSPWESWTPNVAPAIDGSGSVVVFSSTQSAGEHDLTTDFDLFLFQLVRGVRSTPDGGHSRTVGCCP